MGLDGFRQQYIYISALNRMFFDFAEHRIFSTELRKAEVAVLWRH